MKWQHRRKKEARGYQIVRFIALFCLVITIIEYISCFIRGEILKLKKAIIDMNISKKTKINTYSGLGKLYI